MPLFEFKCPVCKTTQEELAPSLERASLLLPCPFCDAWMERAQFSKSTAPDGMAIFFRGSGFHVNDYKEKK